MFTTIKSTVGFRTGVKVIRFQMADEHFDASSQDTVDIGDLADRE